MKRVLFLIVEPLLTALIVVFFGIWLAKWGLIGQESTVSLIGAAVSGGVIGNFSDRLMCRGTDWISAFLATAAPAHLPANHDVVRALRSAQLHAVALIAARAIALERIACPAFDRSSWAYHDWLDTQRRALSRWLAAEFARNARLDLAQGMAPSVHLMAGHIEAVLADDMGRQPATAAMWLGSSAALAEELAARGIDLPESFSLAMAGRAVPGTVSWETCVKAFFWEEVKTNTAVFRVLALKSTSTPSG